ncbi:UNVERIFIED_ORG: hypothetical protein BCL66_105255 [Martelella mediterranea]
MKKPMMLMQTSNIDAFQVGAMTEEKFYGR